MLPSHPSHPAEAFLYAGADHTTTAGREAPHPGLFSRPCSPKESPLPRRTDSKDPADWLLLAASDMDIVRLAAEREISFTAARSKLAEILEKILKA